MKRAIRKRNTKFWVFHFWDLVPIDSALNSASGNLTVFFFKNVGLAPRKACKLENPGEIFLKCPL